MTKYIKNMFGFIVTEPIYVSLQRMRAIHIIALYVTAQWAEQLMSKIPPLQPHADAVIVGVYFTNFIALITVWWTAIQDMRKPHE